MNVELEFAIRRFWGKARAADDSSVPWHPLLWHMLDVAACAQAILAARPGARRTLSRLLGVDQSIAVTLATLIAAFHDIGKFAAAFQAKAEGPPSPFKHSSKLYSEHDQDGYTFWRQRLGAPLASRIWPNGGEILDALVAASTGHHGRAPQIKDDVAIDEIFQDEGRAAAIAAAYALADLLMPTAIDAASPGDLNQGAVSFWFAGFVTIADWAGSTQTFFPYTSPDTRIQEYWEGARNKAAQAVRQLGLASAVPSSTKGFQKLTGLLTPTPLQHHAAAMPLPDGPALVLIEDVTGAGKTEAAQIVVHRLMAAGDASGAYWAMPTQATANAMYDRQRQAIAALFADDAHPQIALAHGQARLRHAFQESILEHGGDDAIGSDTSEADESASAACSAFLASDARAALIADIGAGTIDQAILGVLPARFQAVRLFGLSDKVLIIDEAHAYDAYVSEEMKGLLEFHVALGGSAVVLSATLPRSVKNGAGREQIIRAGMEGLGINMNPFRGKKLAQSPAYPLVTTVCAAGPLETPVEATPWSSRHVPVRFVEADEQVVGEIVTAAKAGASAAWVRNTVDDVLEAATMVWARGIKPIIFHARFAQIDRQRIEADVMRRLGKAADINERKGCVVIATQVIEQSLDIDFDWMTSDLAPIDLLIQRAGRLRRHAKWDPDRPKLPFEIVVRAPPFDHDPSSAWLKNGLKRTQFVYQDPSVLWRTMHVLHAAGGITTPGELRHLIESVYGEGTEIPPGLDQFTARADGADAAARIQGQQGLLNLKNGYRADHMAWVPEEKPMVRTRLGDAQTTLRLARAAADGTLSPWAEGLGPLWRRWAMSELKIYERRAPRGSKADTRFDAAIAAVIDQWGRREVKRAQGAEADLIILPLRYAEDSWRGCLTSPEGKRHEYSYIPDVGLQTIINT